LAHGHPGGELFSHCQSASLVGFQGNLLCQYDVTRYKTIFRHKTPASLQSARVIQLIDIRLRPMAYPVSLSAVAAPDVEIIVSVKLR
jgi:hypothetical protein